MSFTYREEPKAELVMDYGIYMIVTYLATQMGIQISSKAHADELYNNYMAMPESAEFGGVKYDSKTGMLTMNKDYIQSVGSMCDALVPGGTAIKHSFDYSPTFTTNINPTFPTVKELDNVFGFNMTSCLSITITGSTTITLKTSSKTYKTRLSLVNGLDTQTYYIYSKYDTWHTGTPYVIGYIADDGSFGSVLLLSDKPFDCTISLGGSWTSAVTEEIVDSVFTSAELEQKANSEELNKWLAGQLTTKNELMIVPQPEENPDDENKGVMTEQQFNSWVDSYFENVEYPISKPDDLPLQVVPLTDIPVSNGGLKPDTGTDTNPDTGTDTNPDTGTDTNPDTGTDTDLNFLEKLLVKLFYPTVSITDYIDTNGTFFGQLIDLFDYSSLSWEQRPFSYNYKYSQPLNGDTADYDVDIGFDNDITKNYINYIRNFFSYGFLIFIVYRIVSHILPKRDID